MTISMTTFRSDMHKQTEIDASEIQTLKENIRIMKEQNQALAEAHLIILMKQDRYRTALESIQERTGGIINSIASTALNASDRYI